MNKLINRIKHARRSDWQRAINKLLCHTAIVISGMLIVFFLIDRVNKPIGFMTNEFHKVITFVLAILAIYFSVRFMANQRRAEREAWQRRREGSRRQSAPPVQAHGTTKDGYARSYGASAASVRRP